MSVAGDYINDRREHILLSEQQFGLFEGHSLEELQQLYPLEYAHFTKCIDQEGKPATTLVYYHVTDYL